MNIIDLYKTHINPDASWAEIHKLHVDWDINLLWVKHPEPAIEERRKREREEKINLLKRWILKNSKL